MKRRVQPLSLGWARGALGAAACVRVWRRLLVFFPSLTPTPLPPTQFTGRPAGGPLLARRPGRRGESGGEFGERRGTERGFRPQPPPDHHLSRSSPLLFSSLPQIRFQRFGRKKAPFYRLVAIDSRDRREGRPLEVREERQRTHALHPSIPSTFPLTLSSLSPLSFSAWATTIRCGRRPT